MNDSHLPEASIVCVSNSASLKGAGFGDLIDSFAEVVRFNEFQTKGHERDVGTRTTIWIHSAFVPRSHHSVASCREILAIPNWVRRKLSLDPDLETIPISVAVELRSRFSFEAKTWPTTGLFGLAYLLHSYEKVFVCGWLPSVEPESFLEHYYADAGALPRTGRLIRRSMEKRFKEDQPPLFHDLEAERHIYDTWRKEGRVKPIEDITAKR